jgi:hypothetical protein
VGDFSGPPAPYRPGRVAVNYQISTETTRGNLRPREWPLSEQEAIQTRCVVLTGAAATWAQELGESVPMSQLWQHDGVEFHAWVRPLLPDEADCRATEWRYLD